jgi:D-apiose dehydrogenase
MISHHHLLAWGGRADVEVVAICDPDPSRAQARSVEFGVPAAFTDVAAMLAQVHPDVVDVASPVETHAPVVRASIAAGAQVLCQKPLCATLSEAEAVVHSLPQTGRLMIHENWRFRPWYRQVKGWLEAGRIGPIHQAHMATLSSGLLPDAQGARPILVRQAYMGRIPRLMVGEVLIHHLDVLRWLFGPLHVAAAATMHACDAVVGESCASAFMLDHRGASVVLEGDMAARGYPARPTDRLEIFGQRGRILLDGACLTLDAGEPERHVLDLAAGYQASFDAAIGHFVTCLREGSAFETSPADNLATLRLVEAVYAAANAARPVKGS